VGRRGWLLGLVTILCVSQSTVGTVIFNVLDELYHLLTSLNVEVQIEGLCIISVSLSVCLCVSLSECFTVCTLHFS